MKILGDKAISGTFDTVVVGAAINGTALFTGLEYQEVLGLCAKVVVEAETDTVTITARWQISRDNSTWVDVAHGSQNAAGVALATGTGGGDPVVTRYVVCPDEALRAAPWVRLSLVIGGNTGAAIDTYAVSYDYTKLTGAEIGI